MVSSFPDQKFALICYLIHSVCCAYFSVLYLIIYLLFYLTMMLVVQII
jgi:hypothetical protein